MRQLIFKRKYTPEHSNAGFQETLVSDITYWPILLKYPLPTLMPLTTASLDEAAHQNVRHLARRKMHTILAKKNHKMDNVGSEITIFMRRARGKRYLRWPFGRGRLGANAECCQMLPYFCLWTVFLYLLDVGLNVGLPKKRVVVM